MSGLARAALGAAIAAMIAAPAAVLAVPRSDAVAVFAGFGGSGPAVELVARAGGEIVRIDGRSGVTVAVPGSTAGGFVAGLYREGAWLVFDPILVGGCDPRPAAQTREGA